jgi:hypothetical protein
MLWIDVKSCLPGLFCSLAPAKCHVRQRAVIETAGLQRHRRQLRPEARPMELRFIDHAQLSPNLGYARRPVLAVPRNAPLQ